MSARTVDERPHAVTGGFGWAGYLLGFALGGFFDGILLHQILQWHHLLSAVEGAAFRDLRVQVLADGLFHAAMYVVGAAGLWLLWRARLEFAAPGADRLLFANALIGFGAWHVADGILSHWVLGIHRIRMAAENVLLWDLIWFVAFGVLFIAAGWLLRRGAGPGSGARVGRRAVAPLLLAAAVLASGPVAALPPPDTRAVMVLFRPGTEAQAVFAAVAAVDGRVIWADATGDLWAIELGAGADSRPLYRHGALLVSSSLFPIGCLPWLRA